MLARWLMTKRLYLSWITGSFVCVFYFYSNISFMTQRSKKWNTKMEGTSVGVDLKASAYITKHQQQTFEIFHLQSLEVHIHSKHTVTIKPVKTEQPSFPFLPCKTSKHSALQWSLSVTRFFSHLVVLRPPTERGCLSSILTKCSNHLSWLPLMSGSSGWIVKHSQTAELFTQSCRERPAILHRIYLVLDLVVPDTAERLSS